MSVVSKNPFDLLGDDGEQSSPAPAKATPATTTGAAAKKPEAAAQRTVPGAAGGATRGAARGGRYPSRGGPRNVYRGSEDKVTAETTENDGPGGFDGERVPAPKRHHQGPDKHTKGPRGEGRVNTSGGHRSRPTGGARGAKTPAFGGERRQFERRSGTHPDSQKKVDQGWGANEGQAELTAEVEGEKDAQGEETVPATPAAEDAPAVEAEAAEEETPAEPEEVQKSYDQFLAEKAEQAFAFGKKEGRHVSGETLEGKAFVREGIDEFFVGKQDKNTPKTKTNAKKEKVYIEVDGQFASPAGRPPRTENNRGERGGRGGRGRGEGRGRGGNRGGQPRGGFGGSRSNGPAANIADEKAFPALGA